MKDKILTIELSMYYEEEVFEEDFADRVYSISARICASIKKMVVEMKAFARELGTVIHSAQLTVQLRVYLAKVKKELASGHEVYIPDIPKITSTYGKSIDKLRRKVEKIGSELSVIIGSDSRKISKFNENKDDLSTEIDDMIAEISTAIQSSKIKVTPGMSNGMDKAIINTVTGYISSYVKLIDDLEKLVIRFERNASRAEINHDVKIATREHIGVLNRIKQGSTKMVRKSVFAICAITGI